MEALKRSGADNFLPGGEVWAHSAVLFHHRMAVDKTICGACMYELGAVSSRRGGTGLATHIPCPRPAQFDDTVVSSGLEAVAVAMGNLTFSMTVK